MRHTRESSGWAFVSKEQLQNLIDCFKRPTTFVIMYMKLLVVFDLIFVFMIFAVASRYTDRENCQAVKVSRCADFNYNYTLYPNLLQHQRQDDAESELRQYDLLVQSECSPHLRFFLCVLFVPVCTVLNKPLPPCRDLCNEVRSGCETLLNRYGFNWPEQFFCSRFPRPNEDICIGNPQTGATKKEGMSHIFNAVYCLQTRFIRLLNSSFHPYISLLEYLPFIWKPSSNVRLLKTVSKKFLFSSWLKNWVQSQLVCETIAWELGAYVNINNSLIIRKWKYF